MQENIDYELVPAEGADHWNVRIKTGEFIETVFNFGALQVAEDGEHLNFNYEIVSSPIDDLEPENIDLQKCVSEILYNVLENSVARVLEEEKEKE